MGKKDDALKLQSNKKNWPRADIESILRASDFVRQKKKRKHGWMYKHAKYSDLRFMIPNRDPLPPVYATEVSNKIDEIKRRDKINSLSTKPKKKK